MQIGLTREQVNVEGELTLPSLKEIACAFVDRKVMDIFFFTSTNFQISVIRSGTRLTHSADEYNLHGAKRLFTIPNVLSASCPSVKQDDENKWF